MPNNTSETTTTALQLLTIYTRGDKCYFIKCQRSAATDKLILITVSRRRVNTISRAKLTARRHMGCPAAVGDACCVHARSRELEQNSTEKMCEGDIEMVCVRVCTC